MKFHAFPVVLSVLVLSNLVLSGCSDAEVANNGDMYDVSGHIVEAPTAAATVCLDENANLSCDADEPSVVAVDGQFSLALFSAPDVDLNIIADFGISPSGQALQFMAPANQAGILSVYTTMLVNKLQQEPDLSEADALASLKSSLNTQYDVLSNYVADAQDGDKAAIKLLDRAHMMAKVRDSDLLNSAISDLDREGQADALLADVILSLMLPEAGVVK